MDRQSEDGVDMVWRVTPDVSWYRKNEATNRPFALSPSFTANGWSATHFDDIEHVHELLDEAAACTGERLSQRKMGGRGWKLWWEIMGLTLWERVRSCRERGSKKWGRGRCLRKSRCARQAWHRRTGGFDQNASCTERSAPLCEVFS